MSELDTIRKWLTVFVIVVVVGVVLTPFVFVGVWRHQTNVELARIKACGEPTTLADLGTGKVPDAQNASIIYRDAFARISKRSSRDMQTLADFLSPDKRNKDSTLWVKAATVVDKYPDIPALVAVAVSKHPCRFPIDWRQGYSVLQPHLMDLRFLSLLLASRTTLAAKEGKTDEAVHLAELTFKLNEAESNEPSLIPYLMRMSTVGSAARAIKGVTEFGRPSEVQAKLLYDMLARTDLDKAYAKAMQGERVLYMYGPEAAASAKSSGTDPKATRRAISLVLTRDRVFFLSAIRKLIAAGSIPFSEAVSRGYFFDKDTRLPLLCLMSRVQLPILGRALINHNAGKTRIAASQAILALAAYRNRYGTYPESLSELRAKLGWKIPADPFNGKDFTYKRSQKGYLLYSIGPNLKDDAGLPATGKAPSIKSKGDIVWRMER